MKIKFWLFRLLLLIAIGVFANGVCLGFGDGKTKDDAGSSASFLNIDPAFPFTTNIPYYNNRSSDFQTDTHFITLARLKLTDGDGVADDADVTATSVQSITFSITHPADIRRIALYDQFNNVVPGTEQDLNGASSIVFTSLQSYLSAPDAGAITFTVRASFTDVVADHDVIQLNVTAVTADAAGSQFNNVPATLIGGVAGGAITPSNKNMVDVIASQLVFVNQPGPFEGISQPSTLPKVKAIDQNGLTDIDAGAASVTASVGLLNAPTAFISGILDFPGFQYTSPGNGTLTVSVSFPASIPPVVSNYVDVIHVTTSPATGGVTTSSQLFSGSTDNAIFGISFDVPYSVPAGPKLNEFTVDFGNPIAGTLTNFRIYASLDATLNKVMDMDITSFISTVVVGNSLRIVLNTGNNWDDFLHSKPGFPVAYDGATGSTHVSYFIEADINTNANFSVLPVTPSVKRLSYTGPTALNIQISGGSSLANVTGNTYTFKDVSKPVLSTTTPFIGQLNQAINGDIILTFSEPVKALDGKITLFDPQLKKFVADLVTFDPLNVLRTTFRFHTTYIDPVTTLLTNYLAPDTHYYITITGVDANATQGFIDSSNNGFAGIADYSFNFKTSSILPPVVTDAAQFNNVSLRGGTFSIGLDQGGDVFYMVVANPSTPPVSIAEIDGSATYTGGTVLKRGDLKIVQPSTYQYEIVSATFVNNAKYDVYMYAQNDAVVPVATGVLPAITFIAKDPTGAGIILESPAINICPGGFIKVFSPISIVERNIDDFQNKDGDLDLALPSGFIFNTDVTPVLTATGPDFSGPATVEFINNTILHITFGNSTATDFDRLTISGLQIKATLPNATGKITKLAGSAFPSINSSRALANLIVKSRSAVDFTNSENGTRFFSDDAKNVLLIPGQSDFGFNVFQGPGVVNGSDSLYIRLAGIGVHDISMIHTYEDGCVVTKKDVYTIFEHNNAIAGLDKTQYCTTDALATIRYDGRAASSTAPFYLKSLKVDLPPAVLADTVQLLGKYYRSLVKSSLVKTDSIVVGGVMYRSYKFDPTVFNSSQLRNLFKTVDGGGLLGQVEFTSIYVSGLTFKESALSLKINIYVPPAPVITEDVTGLNPDYPSQYCENLGKIKFNALPVPAAGVRTGSFQISRYSTATRTYQVVSGVGVLTDLNDGTALLDTKASVINYGYDSLKIDYYVHSLTSLCDAVVSKKFRITPNPVAGFNVQSAACEGVNLQFNNMSTIAGSPDAFRIAEWAWNFDDPNYFTPDNLNSVTGNTAAEINPMHRYTQATAGGYNPSLVLKSNYGCPSETSTLNIIVGGVPVISLAYSGVVAPITLTNTATVFETNGIDSVQYYYRKHLFTPVTSKKDTAFTYMPVTQTFSPSQGIYDVRLRVKSKLGCVAVLTKKVVVLAQKTVTNTSPYVERFEKLDSGGWQIQPDTLRASWRVGKPGTEKKIIGGDATINGNAFWFTGRNSSYNPREKSYLYSNVYDISQLDRPLITFNTFVQMEQSDGVVLQYSLDDKNVADTTKVWNTLGSFEEGISSGDQWYNAQGLASKPGNQSTKDYGWTGSGVTKWVSSAHSLDIVKGQHRVVFRFALSSVNRSPFLDGFGLDNVRIGNRTRTVLLESFANTGNKISNNGVPVEKTESEMVRSFQSSGLGIEVIKLNYHVGFPDLDPFNGDNPAPPSSRALYYSIAKTPASFLDGIGTPDAATPYFSQWGPGEFSLRTLKLGQAVIEITPLAGNANFTDQGMIGLNVKVTAVETLPANTVLQIAVVEQLAKLPSEKQSMVKTGETEFAYVVKELLPTAGGTKFSADLAAQASRQFGPFKWTPDLKKFYHGPGVNDLSIVVFVQNGQTREVYQSMMVSNLADPGVVTAIEPVGAADFILYPNPSQQHVTVRMSVPASQEVPLTLFNPVGVAVEKVSIAIGERQKTINTESLPSGIYIIQVGEGESIVRKRVIVIH